MALASVKFELLTGQAERSAKRLQDKTKELSNRFREIKNRSNAAGNKIQKFGRQSATASRGVNKLGAAVRKLALAFGVIQTARFVLFKTAELESQRKSLEVLTGSLARTNQIIGELQAFGAVTPFTSTELVETSKRLKAFGVETNKLVDITKRLSDVSGATGARLNEVATAYGQIQAKGKLQTEELLQLQERGIDIATELKNMYGMTKDEFSDALRKGQISATDVEKALVNLTSETGKYFGGAIAQSETLNGKWSTLIDNVGRLAQSIGEQLAPAVKGVLGMAIEMLTAINASIAAMQMTQDRQKEIRSKARGMVEGAMKDRGFSLFHKDISIEHGGETFTGSPSKVKMLLENKLVNEEITRILKEQLAVQEKITTAKSKTNNQDKITKDNVEQVNVKWEQIRETIASGLTSAVEGLIAGTKTLGESLAGIAKSIASMYLKAAFMNMLPGLPGKAEGGYMANGIKPFASGGMVTKPTLGLVGEASEDEYIIPASKMAASMQRYSAGARGEAVIPGTGSSYAGGGAGGSTTVNYSGPILNFNSEEFVPKSAVGQIIASASARGASIGENRTLSTLKNSRSRRSALGL